MCECHPGAREMRVLSVSLAFVFALDLCLAVRLLHVLALALAAVFVIALVLAHLACIA